MLRKLNKKIKGQNTAEYAILIALVVAAAIGMQTYVNRTLKARVHEGMKSMASNVDLGNADALQYEPYYLNTQYDVSRYQNVTGDLTREGNFTGRVTGITRREAGGFQEFNDIVTGQE